jgi:hypothetical protein
MDSFYNKKGKREKALVWSSEWRVRSLRKEKLKKDLHSRSKEVG